ncbi:sugar phosphate nucleotidyltransferase [Flavobacteriales bacterium]|nr:sugar phosphate nucleotidyltransferase [Flavobacteriales bacterium]
MNILVPMAGEGSRFKKDGYRVSKPLILVNKKPMVVEATNHLPKSKNHIYICRKEHIENDKIDTEIEKYYPNSKFITIDYLTEGQASTCLLAKKEINNNEELIIGACDNGMLWDNEKFSREKNEADCLLWTFRNNVTVVNKPEAYGWVEINEENEASRISVKVPISNNPISDHAIVGTFWFKKGKYFVDAAEKMISKNSRINNEFYVDECINELIELGLKVKCFEVDKYICWGTPNDLRTYEYWQEFHKSQNF